MNSRTWSTRLSGAVIGLFVLASCGQATDSPSSTGPVGSAEESADAAPSEPLVVAVQGLGSENWSPWLVQNDEEVITMHVGDTLVRADPTTGEQEPGLALSWDISDDLKTWTFQLRPDVPFHDDWGTVTAEDVEFSWGQLLRDDSLMAQTPIMRQAVGDDMANFRVLGPLEFSVTADDPAVILPVLLSDQGSGLVIQSKEYWETVGEEAAAAHPIGTGPYKFVSSTPGQGATLQAVGSHPFRATPAYGDIEIRIIADNATRLAAVQSGDVDLAPISPLQVGEASAAGVQLIGIPNIGLASMFFGGHYPEHENYDRDAPWIQADEPAKGLAIRQALSLAIDRDLLLERVYAGYGETSVCPLVCFPGQAWVPPSLNPPEYDPDRARELLDEGGYPDGFEFNLWVMEQGARPGTADIVEAIAGMFEEIGLAVNRVPVEQAVMLPNIQDRTTDGYMWMWIKPFYADPAVGVRVGYHPLSTRSHFTSPIIDEALERLETIIDPEERYAIIEQMGIDLVEDAAAIPLFAQEAVYAATERINNWTTIPGYGRMSSFETITGSP